MDTEAVAAAALTQLGSTPPNRARSPPSSPTIGSTSRSYGLGRGKVDFRPLAAQSGGHLTHVVRLPATPASTPRTFFGPRHIPPADSPKWVPKAFHGMTMSQVPPGEEPQGLVLTEWDGTDANGRK